MLSATGLYELFKINVLIEHFRETRLNDKSVSFTRFLIMHYVTDDGNDKDNDRDGQLPFKSHSVAVNSSPIFVLTLSEVCVEIRSKEFKKDYNKYRNPILNSSFCDLVWNPPQISWSLDLIMHSAVH